MAASPFPMKAWTFDQRSTGSISHRLWAQKQRWRPQPQVGMGTQMNMVTPSVCLAVENL